MESSTAEVDEAALRNLDEDDGARRRDWSWGLVVGSARDDDDGRRWRGFLVVSAMNDGGDGFFGGINDGPGPRGRDRGGKRCGDCR